MSLTEKFPNRPELSLLPYDPDGFIESLFTRPNQKRGDSYSIVNHVYSMGYPTFLTAWSQMQKSYTSNSPESVIAKVMVKNDDIEVWNLFVASGYLITKDSEPF
jgi:hypothetical protein